MNSFKPLILLPYRRFQERFRDDKSVVSSKDFHRETDTQRKLQSTYRGGVEIWGVYIPSQLNSTPQLCT